MHCCTLTSAAFEIVAGQQPCDLLTKPDVDLLDRHRQGDAQRRPVVTEEVAQHLLFLLAPSVQRPLLADLADLVREDVRVVPIGVCPQTLEPLNIHLLIGVVSEHSRCPVVGGAILRLGWFDSHVLDVDEQVWFRKYNT